MTALAPRLIGYVFARTGCHGIAEDIAQDALTALVRRWRQQLGPPESPDAFAFAIGRRRAGRALARRALMAPIDALRKKARDEPGVDQSYDDRHELTKVLVTLRALSRTDREALLLRAAGELSFEGFPNCRRTELGQLRPIQHHGQGRSRSLSGISSAARRGSKPPSADGAGAPCRTVQTRCPQGRHRVQPLLADTREKRRSSRGERS